MKAQGNEIEKKSRTTLPVAVSGVHGVDGEHATQKWLARVHRRTGGESRLCSCVAVHKLPRLNSSFSFIYSGEQGSTTYNVTEFAWSGQQLRLVNLAR